MIIKVKDYYIQSNDISIIYPLETPYDKDCSWLIQVSLNNKHIFAIYFDSEEEAQQAHKNFIYTWHRAEDKNYD